MSRNVRTRILFAAVSLFLSLCLVGCSIITLPQEMEAPTIETFPHITQSTAPAPTKASTNPTETVPPVTTLPETQPMPTVPQPEPEDDDFVKVAACIPDIVTDLRYATENNFTGQRIYDFTDVWLRYGTVQKLILIQEELKQQGYSLKIWDGFRPPSAQFMLWDVCPNPTYVSDPNNGFSSHSRGNTVDITLVAADGTELVMPTGFDDFSRLADRNYSDCSREAAENALFLEQLMVKHGFRPYSGEWWHFTDTQTYPVDEAFEPVSPELHYANCNEYISLRAKPSTSAEVISHILVGEQFTVVAKYSNFFLVEYQHLFGYVLSDYAKPVSP